jgi:non-homologous end joining protein Ku
MEVSKMERQVYIKPLELRKRLALKAANRERRSMSFANASNCCGVKLEQKKFCSECHESVNDRECTHKLAKMGKEFVKIPVVALKAREEMLDGEEIVFDTVLKSEPEGASEWYDGVLIGEPVAKAEKEYKVLAELGKKFVFVGKAVFNAREYQVIGKTVEGIFQIRKLVAPTQRNDIDRDEIVKSYEREEVSKELLKVAEQVLAKNAQDDFNLNSFKPADEELEERCVEAAIEGKEIVVPKASVAKEADELERMKALL